MRENNKTKEQAMIETKKDGFYGAGGTIEEIEEELEIIFEDEE